MLLAAGYFDESTDDSKEGKCYTVAGFVGPQEPAVILELRWKDLLKQYDLKYFKASEIETGFGEFEKHRDDPKALSKPLSKREKELIKQIKTSFIDAIVNVGDLHGIGTVLVLPDYYRLQKEYEPAKNLPDPYYLCAQLTMMEAGQMMLLSNRQSPSHLHGNLYPIFDSHKDYSATFKRNFESFAEKNPLSSKYLLPPQYEDDQTHLMLQAADVLAYEARRLLMKEEYEPDRKERIAMTRLKEKCVRRIYKLNYQGLKAIADGQKPDVIPVAPELESNLQLEF